MNNKVQVPMFVSIVTLLLGCYDLLRGVMHTFKLEYSALHIAKLNLTTPEAADLLRLMGVFGISNFITGVMLILLALKARGLALIMLIVIPIAYGIGILEIHVYSAQYAPSHATWGGMTPMLVYLGICVVTFLAGIIGILYNKDNENY